MPKYLPWLSKTQSTNIYNLVIRAYYTLQISLPTTFLASQTAVPPMLQNTLVSSVTRSLKEDKCSLATSLLAKYSLFLQGLFQASPPPNSRMIHTPSDL